MIYIIAGVSGSGKTTIGQKLSLILGVPFFDGDDYHTDSNLQKLRHGIPLTDEDRHPWLSILSDKIQEWQRSNGAVLACSALKESYRRILQSIPEDQLTWVILNADKSVLEERLLNRENHFFNPSLLSSQIEILELPDYGIHVNIDQTVEGILKTILKQMKNKSEIGIIGLGVMGRSLARNIADKGVALSVYNRHIDGKEVDVAKNFVEEYPDLNIDGFDDLEMFIKSLKVPRNILLMVNAGSAVDELISNLLPYLNEDDTVIDAGNSVYTDTKRRSDSLIIKKINYLGIGVSGGEEGALKGPSIMPGGSKKAYERISNILNKIAAKDKNANACCNYIGPDGAGHFVKMFHNGIEYAEMQMIAEVYHYMRYFADYSVDRIVATFQSWQNSDAGSYLLDSTIAILHVKEDDELLLDKILDIASNKGTGGWSTESAIAFGKPLNTISEALMARYLSGMKENRIKASGLYNKVLSDVEILDDDIIKNAYQAGRIINHAIGFDLLYEASIQSDWQLNLAEIARIWTNGCIIRSTLMEQLAEIDNSGNDHLLIIPELVKVMDQNIADLQDFVSAALKGGCAIPVLSASLNYFLAFKTKNSSANLIQAQRDYFGAHTYQRVDESEDKFFHSLWK